MFNVLPDNLKAKIKTLYRGRLLVVIFIFIFFIQLAFLIFLLPSWVISEAKENEIILQTEEINNLAPELSSFSSLISSTNVKLGILNSALQYPVLIPLINTVVSSKTRAVLLNQFTYSLTGTSTATLAIRGISNTREALVSFAKNLQNTKKFKTVDLPISNLAKDKDLDFSINLVIAQQ